MPFPTQPAFVSSGDWDEETRSHPAMKFMEGYTKFFDEGDWDTSNYKEWYTPDNSLATADGREVTGAENAWATLHQVYGPFVKFTHQPSFVMCREVEGGYDMRGQATLFGELPGEPSAGEEKVTDNKGKKWDVAVPAGFRFKYKEEPKASNGYGMLLARSEIMADSGPIVVKMLKRGVMKPSDLGL